jgi:hypothetical protein
VSFSLSFSFFALQATEGPIRATGLNGTDGGSFAAVWRNAASGAGEGAVFNAQGKKLKSLSVGGTSMPSIAALSLSGFVVATRAVAASKATVVKVAVFANNGSLLHELSPTFASVNSAARPRVHGISENRYVVTVLDRFNALFAGVFWNDEQLFIFRVVESVDSWKVIPLSGDSYCIVVRARDDGVRSLCYRANSETQYLYDALELQGYVSKSSDAFDAISLPNNNFVVAVFNTPNVSFSSFNFKDARQLRDDGQQGLIRVTSPQLRINAAFITKAAEAPVLARRPNGGFVAAYEGADRSQQIAVFRNLGTTPPLQHTAERGPIAGVGSVAGLPDNGIAFSFRNAAGSVGVKWLKPTDFGEAVQPVNATAPAGSPVRKRQDTNTTAPAGSPVGSPAGSPAGSPVGSPAGSPVGSPVGSTSAAVAATTTATTAAVAATTTATTAAVATTTAATTAANAAGAASAPTLLTLANGNVVAITLSSTTGDEVEDDDDDDDDDDDEESGGSFSAKFDIYSPVGAVVATGDLAIGVANLNAREVLGKSDGAASLSAALLSLIAALAFALL